MIAEENDLTIGHLFFQKLSENTVKLGLIIVDNTKRGKGYGKQMLECAIDYAFTVLKVNTITLSVFDQNRSAYSLYKNLGFSETGKLTEYNFGGEKLNYIELVKYR